MQAFEESFRAAFPGALEPVRPYERWMGLPGYDPNMRRALVRRKRCLSLVYVVPHANTLEGNLPSRWHVAVFGPGYGAPLGDALRTVWNAYAAQADRRIDLEHQRELGVEAALVSDAEAHHLVLLFVRLEPRDDRRFSRSTRVFRWGEPKERSEEG
jgi:hypothetical protein